MLDLLDITIFLFLTASAFAMLMVAQFLRQKAVGPSAKLRRDPLKVSIAKKSGLDAVSQRFDHSIVRMLQRADIRLERVTALLLIAGAGVIASAVAFVMELPEIVQPVIGILIAVAGFGVYYLLMLWRIQKFNKQFPAGLELMARAARAGESIESAIEISQRSSNQPLKNEFKYCLKQLQLGLPLDAVVDDLARRIGSSELRLFAHTIAIHRSLGGKLADALERLSNVIRKRMECNEKLKSMTSLGRFAVLSIAAMGGFILAYMLIVEPDYIGRLTQSDLGQKLIVYASISELVGLVWVGWTLKSDI